MKQLLATLIVFLILNSLAQITEKFNLSFELKQQDSTLSDGWGKWGKLHVSISDDAHSGKRSAKITSIDIHSNSFAYY